MWVFERPVWALKDVGGLFEPGSELPHSLGLFRLGHFSSAPSLSLSRGFPLGMHPPALQSESASGVALSDLAGAAAEDLVRRLSALQCICGYRNLS